MLPENELEIESVLDEFILQQRLNNLASKTIKDRQYAIQKFVRWLKQSREVQYIEEITKQDIQNFLLDLKSAGMKASYVNTTRKRIKSLYAFLVEEEYLSENIVENIPIMKETKISIKAFTEADVQRLLIGFDKNKSFFSVRDKLITMLLYDVGMRITECLSLTHDDIQTNHIKIRKGKGDKERFVYISNIIRKQMLKYERKKKAFFNQKGIEITPDMIYFCSKDGLQFTPEVYCKGPY